VKLEHIQAKVDALQVLLTLTGRLAEIKANDQAALMQVSVLSVISLSENYSEDSTRLSVSVRVSVCEKESASDAEYLKGWMYSRSVQGLETLQKGIEVIQGNLLKQVPLLREVYEKKCKEKAPKSSGSSIRDWMGNALLFLSLSLSLSRRAY
jgi:hypothetical protein